MPKVTEEHKEARREQILAGAQRAFARYGYEGATVARLEEETGLSRGAIFNYFGNKQALFIELVRRSSDRFVEIWLEQGYRALLEAVDPGGPRVALRPGRGCAPRTHGRALPGADLAPRGRRGRDGAS